MSRMTEVRPTGRPNARLRQTVRDMVLSLAVVLVVIGIILAITWRPQPEAVKAVVYAPQLSQAQQQAGYPILMPNPLPAGWTVTSARWEVTDTSSPDRSWHIGMVTDAGEYVQIEQSATERPEWLPEQLRGEQPVSEIEINGVMWQTYQRADPVQRSLVSTQSGATAIVSGTLSFEDLARFTSTLG